MAARREKPQRATTFDELAAMQQTSRRPCGKQAFSLSQGRTAARIRNQLSNTTWYVVPCFNGCGRDIFHMTNRKYGGRAARRLNTTEQTEPVSQPVLSTRTRKRTRWKANREAYQVISIGTWEDDGGALHSRDLED